MAGSDARSLFAVLGDPIAHSLSPRMHQAAYAALGLPHRYEARRTSLLELPAVMDELRRGQLAGCNLTLPLKQAVLPLVDRVDETARAFGAANTVVRARDGALVAHNTDIPALQHEIRALGFRAGSTAIVLGSGGAARAVIAAIARIGARRIVVRARAAADWLEPLRAAAGHVELIAEPFAAGAVEAESTLVVQATSLGMRESDGALAAAAVDWARLPLDAAALDLVYAPPQTEFLRAAVGRQRANGLGMLVRQGARAFELWLGRRAPLYTMWSAIS